MYWVWFKEKENSIFVKKTERHLSYYRLLGGISVVPVKGLNKLAHFTTQYVLCICNEHSSLVTTK